MMKSLFLFLFITTFQVSSVASFTTSTSANRNNGYKKSAPIRGGGSSAATSPSSTTTVYMLGPMVSSVLAGSIGGAVGVGVAFPLDTLKTNLQVLSRQNKNTAGTIIPAYVQPQTNSSTAAIDLTKAVGYNKKMNMIQLTRQIYETKGISGFFGGVRGVMTGQALIKALAFSSNTCALLYLEPYKTTTFLGSFGVLLVAACFSGFVTGFLVAPVERIKVMMQANPQYENELDCAMAVLRSDEGIKGLMLRGLGPTLAREVPAYGIYFVVYGTLMESQLAPILGQFAPVIFGALSGMACWIPTYPMDVVKTLVQNTEGGGSDEKSSGIDVAMQLHQEGGLGAFYNGITPKLIRAAINHSVTFYVYGLVLNALKL